MIASRGDARFPMIRSPRRRALLAALLATAFAPGVSASDRLRCIGHLSGGAKPQELIAKPLAEFGWIEGKNLRFEVRVSLDMASDAALAAELVRANVDVLMAAATNRVTALAAATQTIPIVSMGIPDPIGQGFARTLQATYYSGNSSLP